MKKEMEWVGQAFLGIKDSGFYAEVFYIEKDAETVVAHAYIEAPKRGDEILGVLIEEIQRKANELGKSVVHKGQPSNKGAARLFKRTPGYERKRTPNGSLFLRTFHPQPDRV